MSYRTYANDPRIITNKFAFTCPTCGKRIPKEINVIYFPSNRKAYCLACGENDYRAFQASAIDEEIYNGRTF